MTLIPLGDSQPDWVDRDEGLDQYKEFKLGQVILNKRKEPLTIIHIQEVVEGTIAFRLLISSSTASITQIYDLMPK